jgi:hypothetical protein
VQSSAIIPVSKQVGGLAIDAPGAPYALKCAPVSFRFGRPDRCLNRDASGCSFGSQAHNRRDKFDAPRN